VLTLVSTTIQWSHQQRNWRNKMNKVTMEIIELLNVNSNIALKIQYKMECDGFDFSECTDKQFKKEVKNIFLTM